MREKANIYRSLMAHGACDAFDLMKFSQKG